MELGLRIESADGGFVARWEGLPITTGGDTWGEALEMAFDAGLEWVGVLRREGILEKVMRQLGHEVGPVEV